MLCTVRQRSSACGICSDGAMAAVSEVHGGLRLQRKIAEEMARLRGPSSQGARCRHPSRQLCSRRVSAGPQTARGTETRSGGSAWSSTKQGKTPITHTPGCKNACLTAFTVLVNLFWHGGLFPT